MYNNADSIYRQFKTILLLTHINCQIDRNFREKHHSGAVNLYIKAS